MSYYCEIHGINSHTDEEYCPTCLPRLHGELMRENKNLRTELADLKEVLEDRRRLTRELDIALSGEEGAAQQASLCDLIEPARRTRAELAKAQKELEEAIEIAKYLVDDEWVETGDIYKKAKAFLAKHKEVKK